MARYKLDFSPEPEVHLIAISSHVKDYRLCWSLNKGLGLRMARRATDIYGDGPEGRVGFPVFDQFGETDEATWSLVGNHAPEGVLVPEQRQADYFLVMGMESPLPLEAVLDAVRGAQFVLAAYSLLPNTLKSAHKIFQ